MSDGARIADDELRRIAHTGDPVAAIHRQIIGSAVRLHIPLRDPIHMRRVATALRVLASALDRESMSKEETWRVLFRSRMAIDEAQLVICPDYGKRSRRRRGG